MNRWKQTEPELLRLIGAASDGTASQRQIDALETRLRADPVAMRLYIDCCQLELDLQVEHYAAAATSRALVSIDQPIAGAPASKRPFPAWIAREIHWKSHPGRFVGLSLGLMIAFWFALFAIVGPRLQESKTEESPQAAAMRAPMVARLRQAIGCEWEEVKPFSTPSVGLFLQQGRTLRLKHGLAELVFNRGTMVVLEGPCEFTLLGDNAGRLESGKLMAHVPPGAVGFITHTPHATVTDLGTHFCVEVVEADTEVMCFEGAVRLAAGSPEQGDRRTSVLTAGNSAVVAHGSDATGGGLHGVKRVTNCIVRNNAAVVSPEIHGAVTVEYSNVKGGWQGTGNMDREPRFLDNEYHLLHDSPCRDKGTNTAPALPSTDRDGDPRVAYGTVDIGSDEFFPGFYHTGTPSPGNIIQVRIIGDPGKTWYWAFSSNVINPPVPLPGIFGVLHLHPGNLAVIPMGTFPATRESGFSYQFSYSFPRISIPIQALMGDQLSNLDWVHVR